MNSGIALGGVDPVWRLEFQLKQEVITQKGLQKLSAVLDHLNGLWSYATTEWLRLTLPNREDQTRFRWPIHPLWGYLSSVDWQTNDSPLLPRFSSVHVPGNDKLCSSLLSCLTSFMVQARIWIMDLLLLGLPFVSITMTSIFT